ncbi:uncharacterized protein LOC135836864 [Planococcus citri]|uniref:uncharacterized protein LOC135836864 n=1 Tax=Planococcus citri TaxID=170843 RepID=UPI0031F75635
MILTLKLFVLYLIISSSIGEGGVTKKTLTSEEKVEKELKPIEENLKLIMDPNTGNDKKMYLKGEVQGMMKKIIEQALKADSLLVEQGAQEYKKELTDEWAWFELIRQLIEDYDESNFPHPCDDDFESKKVEWDKARLAGKTSHERNEEERYQKFKYYLENPPNEAVQKLRNRLNEANIAVETFSKGIAKAYRFISGRIRDGYMKCLGANWDSFYHQEDVLTAVGILLDEMGISKKLIKKIEQKAQSIKKEG